MWAACEKNLTLVYVEALQNNLRENYGEFNLEKVVYEAKQGWEAFYETHYK